jgi:hypothetical protein
MEDIKSSKGRWLRRSRDSSGAYPQTRSSILWSNLNQRLKALQPRDETYAACINQFSDFQNFAEWCQTQANYTSVDNKGNYYQLDKDILVPGNKIYGPDTCCFIPAALNKLFSRGNNKTNKYLLGTCLEPKSGKFVAHVTGLSELKSGYIGIYKDEMDAHRAWQLGKIEVFNRALDTFEYLPNEVLLGLKNHMELLQNQYDNYETTS